MLGLFGDSVIGTDHLTGPTTDDEVKSARFARHTPLHGRSVLQDLGNDNGTKRLRFFFDETFCDVQVERAKIEAAFLLRVPMRLFLDLRGFEVGVYIIERLRIRNLKTTSRGRLVRVEIEVELVESPVRIDGVLDAAAGTARAALNPALRRIK
ncbi:phage tail protein [uncultured Tateyamaria sp.]|uniref:phage tail protein n=1 Tax=uncultured Tateyamaria sp. TaxID=455651 RepID=UPI00260E7041|nr:phage tail protein [uncultured Tateyamaria sp.]